jgi:hypothetical protein
MPGTAGLRPATRDELTQSVSFALRFNGRKRVDADDAMARITVRHRVPGVDPSPSNRRRHVCSDVSQRTPSIHSVSRGHSTGYVGATEVRPEPSLAAS